MILFVRVDVFYQSVHQERLISLLTPASVKPYFLSILKFLTRWFVLNMKPYAVGHVNYC